MDGEELKSFPLIGLSVSSCCHPFSISNSTCLFSEHIRSLFYSASRTETEPKLSNVKPSVSFQKLLLLLNSPASDPWAFLSQLFKLVFCCSGRPRSSTLPSSAYLPLLLLLLPLICPPHRILLFISEALHQINCLSVCLLDSRRRKPCLLHVEFIPLFMLRSL